jgi:hypothetical protein
MHIIHTAPGLQASGYRQAVEKILEHPGTKVTKQYQQILDGIDHANAAADTDSGSEAFSAAVIAGDEHAIRDTMREWQLQRNSAQALLHDADAAIGAALRAEYANTARHNYNAVAKAFNEKAEALAAAAKAVDLSRPADEILLAPDAQRRAWSDAAVLSAELDRLAELLDLAARLARLGHDATGSHHGHIGALTIDRPSLNNLATWQALEQPTHRAGRWSELVTLGARIRAVEPDQARPALKPVTEVSWEPGEIGHRRVETVTAPN